MLAPFQALNSHKWLPSWTSQIGDISVIIEHVLDSTVPKNKKKLDPHSNNTVLARVSSTCLRQGTGFSAGSLTPLVHLWDLPSVLDAVSKPCLVITRAINTEKEGPD